MLRFTRRRGATLIYVFGGFVAPMTGPQGGWELIAVTAALVPSLAAAQDSAPLRPVEADLQVRLNCDRVAATLKLPDATVTAAWALGHPEKIADFGHRAVHETAVHSKSAISNFYGMAPKLSYFTGCSGGGRMAFQEAQQGWADPNVSPRSPLMYYDRVVKTVGRKAVDEGMRLFYAPGMGHCGGGEGPNVFDALTPLEQWRELGKPPSSILATHSTAGKVDRSRPLCPYPQIARYKGTGSIDQAENFSCAAPAE